MHRVAMVQFVLHQSRYIVYRPRMQTFADIINLWDTAEAFGADLGITGLRARQWRNRNSIPPEWWTATVEAAKRRDLGGVSLQLLADLAARRREPEAAA